MKTVLLSQVRVEPRLRAELEGVLREGEAAEEVLARLQAKLDAKIAELKGQHRPTSE